MKLAFKFLQNLRIPLFLGLFGFLIFFVYGCSKPSSYQFTVDNPTAETQQKIEKINIFLETSVSMKGYVNANNPGNYVLKDVLP